MSSSYCSIQNPYGVKPLGNLLCQSADVLSKRAKSFGSFSFIPEDILLSIMGFLSITDVCTLSQVSRVIYVYCHHSELWRDATLNRWPGNFYYRTCWKDTYAHKLLLEKGKISSFAPHVPLRVNYMFSDLLHRSWACRSYDVRSACKGFYSRDNVQRRQADLLSVVQFVDEFERPNIPLVIEGCCADWDALKYDYVSRHHKDKKNCQLHDGNQNNCAKPCESQAQKQWYKTTSSTGANLRAADILFTFDQYLAYAAEAFEEAPLYLFDANFVDHAVSTIGEDKSSYCTCNDAHPGITEKDFKVPDYFRMNVTTGAGDAERSDTDTTGASKWEHRTDLFHLLQEEVDGTVVRRRPDYRWLIAGPAFSGSFFHKDPNMTNAWNAVIKGRKKWIFYPPDQQPPGCFATADGAEVAVPVSVGEWLLSFWPEHLAQRKAAGALECVVGPGDCVFVPHGWWHMVINVDELSVAITQNYVSTSNLCDCLRFLRETPDQISGLGLWRLEGESSEDKEEKHEADSRQNNSCYEPTALYSLFIDRLRVAYPEIGVDAVAKASFSRGTFAGIGGGVAPESAVDGNGNGLLDKKRKRSTKSCADVLAASAETSEAPSTFQFSFF